MTIIRQITTIGILCLLVLASANLGFWGFGASIFTAKNIFFASLVLSLVFIVFELRNLVQQEEGAENVDSDE